VSALLRGTGVYIDRNGYYRYDGLIDGDTFHTAASQGALDEHVWIELFDKTGYTHDGVAAQRPTEAVTVYRGSDLRVGMSWTSNPDTAQKFATAGWHGRPPGEVYIYHAQPDELLAYIHTEIGRGESEYVIDPTHLYEDDVAEYVPPPPRRRHAQMPEKAALLENFSRTRSRGFF